nr:uncharacterized protein LOC124811345 [Hydra vulgaris]
MCVSDGDEEIYFFILNDSKYWLSVLRRTVGVVKFLAERGLQLCGHEEKIGSVHNGNFMGILELLALYDFFLVTHIDKHGNLGRGKTSYLSSTVCDELINLMGQKVLLFIVDEIKKAKYCSVSIDSTPDLSHVNQLSVTARYVNKVEPIEHFLAFIKFKSHTGIGLSNALLEFLEKDNIDIGNCRGQTHDNASNMSGC